MTVAMWWLERRERPLKLSAGEECLLTAAIAVLAALLRFPELGQSLHSDSLLWLPRIERFWEALIAADFKETYQSGHPGVPLMWLSGLSLKLAGLLGGRLNEAALVAAKVPVALAGSLMAALTFPLLTRVLGRAAWLPALLGALLIASEPYLVEQARMLHLDSLGLSFLWLGLLVTLLAVRRDSWRIAIGAGALLGAGCLTKLPLAPIAAMAMALVTMSPLATGARWWSGLRIASIVTLAALCTAFVIWPALWVDPVGTVARILEDTSSASQKGAKEAEYYATFIASATPWHTAACATLGAAFLAFRKGQRWPYLVLALSLLPYLLVILVTPKKLTRYVLPFFPVMAALGGLGLAALSAKLQGKRSLWLAAAGLTTVLVVGRFVEVATRLPSASICTPWPGLPCAPAAPDMYYMREIALAIKDDQARVGAPKRTKVHTSSKAKLMAPWLSVKQVRKAKKADYIVLWNSDYADESATKLPGRLRKRLKPVLGPSVAEVRDHGTLVARVYRKKNRGGSK